MMIDLVLEFARRSAFPFACLFCLLLPLTHVGHVYRHRKKLTNSIDLICFPLRHSARHAVFQIVSWVRPALCHLPAQRKYSRNVCFTLPHAATVKEHAMHADVVTATVKSVTHLLQALWGVSTAVTFPVSLSYIEKWWHQSGSLRALGDAWHGLPLLPPLISPAYVPAASGMAAALSFMGQLFMLKSLLVFDARNRARLVGLRSQHQQHQQQSGRGRKGGKLQRATRGTGGCKPSNGRSKGRTVSNDGEEETAPDQVRCLCVSPLQSTSLGQKLIMGHVSADARPHSAWHCAAVYTWYDDKGSPVAPSSLPPAAQPRPGQPAGDADGRGAGGGGLPGAAVAGAHAGHAHAHGLLRAGAGVPGGGRQQHTRTGRAPALQHAARQGGGSASRGQAAARGQQLRTGGRTGWRERRTKGRGRRSGGAGCR